MNRYRIVRGEFGYTAQVRERWRWVFLLGESTSATPPSWAWGSMGIGWYPTPGAAWAAARDKIACLEAEPRGLAIVEEWEQ